MARVIVECPTCRSRYDIPDRRPGTQVRCRCRALFSVPAPAETAGALACPICGAPARLDETSCRYCRSALATAACPRCLGRVFEGHRFCPHCGARLGAEGAVPPGAKPRLCPRCAPALRPLTAHVVAGTLLDECHACGGVFVDAHAFQRLVEERDRQAVALERGVSSPGAGRPAPGAAAPVRYLPCPDCGVLMNRKNFGERSGVVIEYCKPHGFWFDQDQLGQALRFVMAGGLEESRRRQLEELDRALAHKRDELADPAAGAGTGLLGRGVFQPAGGLLVDAAAALLSHLFRH